jgi:DNA-binding GntR family transcriptional regulator
MKSVSDGALLQFGLHLLRIKNREIYFTKILTHNAHSNINNFVYKKVYKNSFSFSDYGAGLKSKRIRSAKWVRRAAVMEAMRERIVDGHYPQGVKLTENGLVEEFGISRPVLREILADLESQGLVERRPNRGTVVRRVDSISLLEIMEIREVLEGLAARLAARNSRPEDWKEIEKKFGAPAEKMVKEQDFDRFLEIVANLREQIVKAAKNEELTKLIYSLFAKITIVQRRVVILPGRMEQSINEHREVIKALISGDEDVAEQKKKENLRSAREYLKKYKKWVL